MQWTKFRLKTTTEAEDIVSAMLMDLGVEGVEIEDGIALTQSEKEQMFVDILPPPAVDDGIAYLSFYMEEGERQEVLLAQISEELGGMRQYVDVGEGTIERTVTEDVDWINNWKEFFHQFTVDHILITPSWETPQVTDDTEMVIRIDPGTAFGTGMHETTQLCIRQLKKYVRPHDQMLDVGCGSGILGMLAVKFGADRSVGLDLDPCAVDATKENMHVNGVQDTQYEVMIGNLIDDDRVLERVGRERYDIVAANILAEVLIPMAPRMMECMKPGAVLITSGIIDDKEETVKEQFSKAGFEIVEVTYMGEWVSVTARKPIQ